ncbi:MULTISPECIES: hypothetical protein [Acetobacter]|uniref:hypothetical protein n=1 Tax=Acetobacter TaxID=434 RepID=UPI000F50CB78|nr:MULTISPECIES: hypothetical protein [Acetobacter]KAA8394032.1 hypothetical protein FKW19_12900 [Acetobacter sp. DmW_125128]KAA8394741.1 hypothetical protein FKW22_09665 [Acetobacter sp. DmW_125124]KAA8400884.1 hypothetical protein FKW20_00570 [Acetobacter sp. DmW_125127]KAA8406807.1 hypothetical protein FKW32_03115 [Acetobacter sp. DmW_125132]KAA8407570.1 hypothetical protein FKW15_02590 [Acetobacter sp. DmW_125133]
MTYKSKPMLARAETSEGPLAAQQARAILCTTPTQHTKTGLQHDTNPQDHKMWENTPIWSQALEGSSGYQVGRTAPCGSSICSYGGANTRHQHDWLGSSRFGRFCRFGFQHPVSYSRSNIVGGGKHYGHFSCCGYLSLQMVRNRRAPRSVYGFTSANRISLSGISCSLLSKCHPAEYREAKYYQHTYIRRMDYVSSNANISLLVSNGNFYAEGVLTGHCTRPVSSAGNGAGRGGYGFSLSLISFLIESCERPMMENAGEYGNRLSRNSANKTAGASA